MYKINFNVLDGTEDDSQNWQVTVKEFSSLKVSLRAVNGKAKATERSDTRQSEGRVVLESSQLGNAQPLAAHLLQVRHTREGLKEGEKGAIKAPMMCDDLQGGTESGESGHLWTDPKGHLKRVVSILKQTKVQSAQGVLPREKGDKVCLTTVDQFEGKMGNLWAKLPQKSGHVGVLEEMHREADQLSEDRHRIGYTAERLSVVNFTRKIVKVQTEVSQSGKLIQSTVQWIG